MLHTRTTPELTEDLFISAPAHILKEDVWIFDGHGLARMLKLTLSPLGCGLIFRAGAELQRRFDRAAPLSIIFFSAFLAAGQPLPASAPAHDYFDAIRTGGRPFTYVNMLSRKR